MCWPDHSSSVTDSVPAAARPRLGRDRKKRDSLRSARPRAWPFIFGEPTCRILRKNDCPFLERGYRVNQDEHLVRLSKRLRYTFMRVTITVYERARSTSGHSAAPDRNH